MFKVLLGEKIGIIIWLIIGIGFDLANKKIPRWYAWGTLLTGILVGVLLSGGDWCSLVLGGSVGGSFFVLAKITKEQIGYGDAFVLTGIGAAVGLERVMWILLYSFSLLFLVGIILLLSKRAKRDTSIAFMPFIFLGYCLSLIFYGGSV